MMCTRHMIHTTHDSLIIGLSSPFVKRDIVNIDVTTYSRGGYHGDLNETFCVGNVDADGRRVVQTAFECLSSALALVKPGTLYRDLGSTIQRVAAANKCSVVRTYCGHGIGSLFHTAPNVPVRLGYLFPCV